MAARNPHEARSALAHELKTPLAVIAGYAELLRLRDDERTRLEASARILEAVDALSASVNALVDRFLPLPAAPAGGTFRVALVDDDEGLRSLLRATFAPDEYTIVEARDGHEALALLEREPADIVVLDWDLPGRPGADVLSELKARRPELPVVVLTAGAAPAAQAADAFLGKPFSPVQLLDVVQALLTRD